MYEVIDRWRGRQKRLLHARVVLLTTGALITRRASFYLFEAGNVLLESATRPRATPLFQSVTPRTCGFNTVDIAALANPTILLMMILMRSSAPRRDRPAVESTRHPASPCWG